MKKMLSILFAFIVLLTSSLHASEKAISVFLLGTGLVGEELIHQIDEGFSAENPIEIRIVGMANSRFMLFDAEGIDLKNWKTLLNQSTEIMTPSAFIMRMKQMQQPNSVFVDCTSNQAIANAYAAILESNIAIVTPNKKANTGTISYYQALQSLALEHRVSYLYDATVGAGLPIIKTIQILRQSHNDVVKVEAILSGTLSYLFNSFDGTVPFSTIVKEAQTKGFTEPDPRDDLNGLDMARKFLILARESGLNLELSDVEIMPFLPEECFKAPSVDEFYSQLQQYDAVLTKLCEEAKQNGKVLRFIGTLENGRAMLSLRAVGVDHPFYSLSGPDNIASIYSRYYSNNPIVIRGPGAGAQVTAAAVLANIVQAVE